LKAHLGRLPLTLHGSAVLAIAMAAPALAGSPHDVSMFWQVAGDSGTPINFDLAEAGIWSDQEDGSVVYTGNLFSETWQLSWTTRVDTQTEVLLDTLVSVTNTSSTEQWFTSLTMLDTMGVSTDQQLLSLAATLTVMNLQFSGQAELASIGTNPVITSRIDGTTEASLFEPIYALTSVGPFAVATDSGSTTAMVNGYQQSLQHGSEFSLTAGDTATFHTITTLSSIPTPGSLAVLLTAALTGGLRRRRRSIPTRRLA
jgi:hypothetical protein